MSRLRGHHLICLNFFRGEGYSPEFVENLKAVLSDGEIQVVFGADDVCVMCPYLRDGLCSYSDSSEEEVTELDQMAYRLLGIYPGQRTTWQEVRDRLSDVMGVWKKFACSSCDWKAVCEKHEDWQEYL
ncbi:DUF1284 domain-containing protein [Geoglobus sp.]